MWTFLLTFIAVALIESALTAFTPLFRGLRADPFKSSPLEIKITSGQASFKEKMTYFAFSFVSSPFNILIYIITGITLFIISLFS
jgi:hypothetical protein